MSREVSVHDIIIRLGVYRSLYNSAVQFNSVLFRLIVGVLAISYGVPVDTVALVTLIEFSLNGLLEVPFGYIADRIGRVPSIAICLGLFMSGLTCVYIALLIHNDVSRYLFILHGILIGVGKPFSSGAVEAFYQDALKRRCRPEEEKILMTSLTTSQNHGKYYTTIAVVAAFALSAPFHQWHLLPHTFLIGISLYLGCFVTLLRDYRQIGDIEPELHPSSPIKIIFSMIKDPQSRMSVLHNLSFWMMTVVIAGYLIVSLGREYSSSNQSIQWTFMIAFMLGSAMGWIAKGHILPRLIGRWDQKRYLLFAYGVTFLSSLGVLLICQTASISLQIISIFIYGVIFQTSSSAIMSVAMNELLSRVNKQDYATALSFQNIPGYLWVGIYSGYLKLFRDGTPSVREAFFSVIVISLIAIIILQLGKSLSASSKASGD